MIPGLIRWFHDREARAIARDQSALIDQLGIPTKAIRSIVGQFHGYALAAPLRGAK